MGLFDWFGNTHADETEPSALPSVTAPESPDGVLEGFSFSKGLDVSPQSDLVSHIAPSDTGEQLLVTEIGTEKIRWCLKRTSFDNCKFVGPKQLLVFSRKDNTITAELLDTDTGKIILHKPVDFSLHAADVKSGIAEGSNTFVLGIIHTAGDRLEASTVKVSQIYGSKGMRVASDGTVYFHQHYRLQSCRDGAFEEIGAGDNWISLGQQGMVFSGGHGFRPDTPSAVLIFNPKTGNGSARNAV
jgi:hypothetical protein